MTVPETDLYLLKVVHREVYGPFNIMAMIDRFGGLSVFVNDEEGNCIWQGDNIIEARRFCRNHKSVKE